MSFAAAKRIIQVSQDAARINYIYLSSEMAHVTPFALGECVNDRLIAMFSVWI